MRQYLVPSILSLSLTRASPIPFPLRISLSLSLSSIESRYIYCTQILRSTRRYLFLFIIAWKKSSSREEISSIFQSNSITLRELIRLKVYIYIYIITEREMRKNPRVHAKKDLAPSLRTPFERADGTHSTTFFSFSPPVRISLALKKEREREISSIFDPLFPQSTLSVI